MVKKANMANMGQIQLSHSTIWRTYLLIASHDESLTTDNHASNL